MRLGVSSVHRRRIFLSVSLAAASSSAFPIAASSTLAKTIRLCPSYFSVGSFWIPCSPSFSCQARSLSMARSDISDDDNVGRDGQRPPATTRSRKNSRRKNTTPPTANDGIATEEGTPAKKRTKKAKEEKGGPPTSSSPRSRSTTTTTTTTTSSSPPKKPPAHQVLTERDPLPKLWDRSRAKDSYTFTIATWNVAGLRALQKKDPDAIPNLIHRLNLDVLCLQETKLQEAHLTDPKVVLPDVPGYTAHYSCSTAKKGYAGTACFIRNHTDNSSSSKDPDGKTSNKKKGSRQTTLDGLLLPPKGGNPSKTSDAATAAPPLPVPATLLQPQDVSAKMGVEQHDQEGRILVMDFPLFTAVNLYVPNSGQKLERLDYRTEQWDKDLLAFCQQKQKDRGVPVVWLGDLNVAHTHLEVWNDGAKHLAKQAGVTAQERSSFQAQLDAGFVDAFRRLHPTAAGHYSYWSQRAGNRPVNKGLRLDYFICDPVLFDDDPSTPVVVRDSYLVPEQEGSDHCPAVLEMEIRNTAAVDTTQD